MCRNYQLRHLFTNIMQLFCVDLRGLSLCLNHTILHADGEARFYVSLVNEFGIDSRSYGQSQSYGLRLKNA